MELSAAEIADIQEAWSRVTDIEGFGACFFNNLFKIDASAFGKFPKFAGKSDADLKVAIRGHGLKVMTSLGSVIRALNDRASANALNKATGDLHKGKGVGGKLMSESGAKALEATMICLLGKDYPCQTNNAFKKLFGDMAAFC